VLTISYITIDFLITQRGCPTLKTESSSCRRR